MDHILGHKISLNKSKRIEVQCVFQPQQNQPSNQLKKIRKYPNNPKPNSTLPNNLWVREEVSKQILKYVQLSK